MGFRDLAVSNLIGGIYTTILKSGAETALFPTDSCVGTEKKRAVHTLMVEMVAQNAIW